MEMAKVRKMNKVPLLAFLALILMAVITFTIGNSKPGFYDNLMPNLFTLSVEGMLFVIVFEYYKKYESTKQNKGVLTLLASYFGHLFIILNAYKNFRGKQETNVIVVNYVELIDWALENYKNLPFDDIQRECANIYETRSLLIGLVSQLDKGDLLATTAVIRNLKSIADAKSLQEVEKDCWMFFTFLKGVVSKI